MVSSDFGKLEVRRHLISGDDCAIAGEATAVAAAPAAETFKKSRRFIQALLEGASWNFLERIQRRREFASADGAPVQGSNTDIGKRKRNQRMTEPIKRKSNATGHGPFRGLKPPQ
jgi:hypothetical protein